MYHKISKKTVLPLFLSVTLLTISAYGLNNVGEKCTISKGSGITVDSCDGSKLLSCQYGRCACNDAPNKIYSYRLEKVKRVKRGIGKNVAIGAGGVFAGYHLGKFANSGGQQPSQSWGSNLYQRKVYGCYGLVGTPCALPYNNVKIIKSVNSTAKLDKKNGTTDGNFGNSSDVSSATATTTETPAAFDLQKMSKCVYRAVCMPRNSGGNSTWVIQTDDPRVGVCTCDMGYKRTSTDTCGAAAPNNSEPSSFLFTTLIILYSISSIF